MTTQEAADRLIHMVRDAICASHRMRCLVDGCRYSTPEAPACVWCGVPRPVDVPHIGLLESARRKAQAVNCPRCGTPCERDEVDVGVGSMAASGWGCPDLRLVREGGA